jgi:NADH:ubiquinone oxidoreductase subunit F (NADH-binding)/NADH:ubiquinone oxidoreductase subunit E/NAD-dependent dihydropyrimidine dehydrogenase PreA subunit
MSLDLTYVDQAVERLGRAPEAAIPLLQALQTHYGYLPESGLRRICELTEITPAAITGVASFYDMFRTRPAGKHIVRVCRGTACHVAGAERIEDALRRQLRIPKGSDTDPDREFTVEPVACLGCCTLAPVVKIGDHTFGHLTAEKVPNMLREYRALAGNGSTKSTEELIQTKPARAEIRIGLGSCCMAKGSDQIYHALQESVARTGADVTVKRVGCVGMCHRTPLVEISAPGQNGVLYEGLDPASARELVQRRLAPQGLLRRASRWWTQAVDLLLTDSPTVAATCGSALDREAPEVSAFLDRQVHIATEGFGKADPLDLDEYVAKGGFEALAKCVGQAFSLSPNLQKSGESLLGRLAPSEKPQTGASSSSGAAAKSGDRSPHSTGEDRQDPSATWHILAAIEQSGLRGRGGAGFPTGKKWRVVADQPGETKYVICNGDEGDPGAFMDRMILESFPFKVIEGLAIAAVAVGAHEGIFYIRHEYPLAVKRVRAALKLMKARGWLGDQLLGSDYAFSLRIVEGAGAFVCGEETALIASVEGQRGMPRLRPPFPAQQGLWGQPTLINNVETLSMVPWIIRHGADKFAAHGTTASKGTKVFALAGKIQRAGLIEIPMGTTIREIVEEIGGGVEPGRRFKAVQIGGPSGGCVPARLMDTPVDFESLREVGAIMGSGGLVVLDDTACMVDIARYFLQFTQSQSCGKCTFCRVGTKRMLDLLDRFCTGRGTAADLAALETLARQVGAGSLCGLGKTAPNPVLSTLRYFRDEYEAHIAGRCPAGKCTALIHYRITDQCTGCTLCAQACPVDAIPMTPYARHEVIDDKCTRCDSCRQACPEGAVEMK